MLWVEVSLSLLGYLIDQNFASIKRVSNPAFKSKLSITLYETLELARVLDSVWDCAWLLGSVLRRWT